MNKAFTFLMIICLVTAQECSSQHAYNLSYRQDVYSEITSGIPFTDKIPLPFMFSLDGISGDTLYTTTTGYLSTSGNYKWDLPYFLSFGADTHQGDYSYEISGISGNRILKMQFKNIKFGHDFNNSDFMNFQTWIYESDHAIEVHFGSSNVANPVWSYYYNEGGPAIGFKNLKLSGLPATPVIDTAIETRLYGTPGDGMIYRFALSAGTGIGSYALNELRFFPNPANGTLYMDMGKNSETSIQIRIMDLLGRQVYNANQNHSSGPMKLTLNAGHYIIHYQSKDRQGRAGIVVVK